MVNDRNNFEKNKYNAQIKGEQISNLEKEKSNNKLADKIEDGLNIHSMPNSFRAGKFNASVHPNDIKKKGALNNLSSSANKHKYVGVLIIVVGILILGGLGYFLYNYIMGDSEVEEPQIVQEDNNANNEEAEEDVDLEGDEEEVVEDEDDNGDSDDDIVFDEDGDEDINQTEDGLDGDESATSTDDVDEIGIKEAKFKIYTITGKLVYSKEFKTEFFVEEFAVDELINGVYFYKIEFSDNSNYSGKLVILK
jgi:hypothetical protein